MIEIIPAIMPQNYEDLKNKLASVRGLVNTVQIDLMDGRFTRGITWPFSKHDAEEGVFSSDPYFLSIMNEREGLPFWEDVDFELDLMVKNAADNLDFFFRLGPKRLVFHIEAEENAQELLEFIEGIDLYIRDNIEIGVAINPTTPIENIFPLLNVIDFVQCMGIENIGFQGEPFDERVFDHIKRLRSEHEGIIISVDGGVNFDTAPRLMDAGVDRLVIGSAIFRSGNIHGAIEELKNL